MNPVVITVPCSNCEKRIRVRVKSIENLRIKNQELEKQLVSKDLEIEKLKVLLNCYLGDDSNTMNTEGESIFDPVYENF